jgi:hypothetical protein
MRIQSSINLLAQVARANNGSENPAFKAAFKNIGKPYD